MDGGRIGWKLRRHRDIEKTVDDAAIHNNTEKAVVVRLRDVEKTVQLRKNCNMAWIRKLLKPN